MARMKFDKGTIKKVHGDVFKYRDLYKGKHAEYSKRATTLINNGEIIDYIQYGDREAQNVRTPYLIANICKVICDVPSLLISRSMGDVLTNHKDEVIQAVGNEDMVEGDDESEHALETIDMQQEMLNQIADNSKLISKHKQNILQHQIDGGIVGVPQLLNGKPSIAFKDRTVYYPHADEKGVTLRYELDKEDDDDNDYVHEYIEREEDRGVLTVTNKLYERNKYGELTEVTNNRIYREVLGDRPKEKTFGGRHRTFVRYLGNNVTHIDPLGVSELEGLEAKQEEVNWTITRSAIIFERNGKPRIGITPAIMQRLREIAEDRYDDPEKIDHRDLELVEMDEDGRALETYQIDISKIGDLAYVKDIIRMMLTETNTSANATEFISEGAGSGSAQSGVAKFYDLWVSATKAESIRKEYIEFLRECFEGVLWLVNQRNTEIIVEKPVITTESMIPKPKDETDREQIARFTAGVQSLYQTVRELHPNKDDDWVEEEVARIQDAKASDDSFSLKRGRQRIQGLFGNRDEQGRPLNNDGTPREEESDEAE